jgi:hypothetical protein
MKMSEPRDFVRFPHDPDYLGQPVDPAALTQERKKTHGDWAMQSRTANRLKELLRREGSSNWDRMTPSQQEALDMIATKISRILTGDPNEPDHWNDIAGYAHLGLTGHTEV